MSNYVRLLDAHTLSLQVSNVCRWDVEDSQIDVGAIVPDSASLRPIDDALVGEVESLQRLGSVTLSVCSGY